MVEESTNAATKPNESKAPRPKPLHLWSTTDVFKWLTRQCSETCVDYAPIMMDYDIAGVELLLMNDQLLAFMVKDPAHRQEILREIIKLRSSMDSKEIMNLERLNINDT